MKTLILVRHAKSSWENFSLPDEERPLNERGKKNAPEMAERLLKKGIQIDGFFSSHATRALATAASFAKVYNRKKKEIIIVPALYMASPADFEAIIRQTPDEVEHLALFSHNYGITEFANLLSNTRVDHMPTCAVFAVRCQIERWGEFQRSGNEFYFFDFPKSI